MTGQTNIPQLDQVKSALDDLARSIVSVFGANGNHNQLNPGVNGNLNSPNSNVDLSRLLSGTTQGFRDLLSSLTSDLSSTFGQLISNPLEFIQRLLSAFNLDGLTDLLGNLENTIGGGFNGNNVGSINNGRLNPNSMRPGNLNNMGGNLGGNLGSNMGSNLGNFGGSMGTQQGNFIFRKSKKNPQKFDLI